MGCNGTVRLSARCRVAGWKCLWFGPKRPHPELEFTLYVPAISSALGGQSTAGRRLIPLLICSRTKHSIGKGLKRHQTQADMASEYSTHRIQ